MTLSAQGHTLVPMNYHMSFHPNTFMNRKRHEPQINQDVGIQSIPIAIQSFLDVLNIFPSPNVFHCLLEGVSLLTRTVNPQVSKLCNKLGRGRRALRH